MKIKSEDISVVVQGAISTEFTEKVLNSIRKYLPNAEIILSTWKGSEVSNLDYDVLVENIDPGAELLFKNTKIYHNLNRQIVSTKEGIKKASRKYVFKTRTDISLTGKGFLNYFEKFTQRCDECKFVEKRVVTSNCFARYPRLLPFHPGDWVFFGLKEDLLKIWDIPLAPEPETTNWFYSHELLEQHMSDSWFSHFRHRYCAEQYIWIEFLKKYMPINFEHMFDITPENIRLTEVSFANNIVIITDKQFGIKFLKGHQDNGLSIYNHPRWKYLYKTYCDNSYQLSTLEYIVSNPVSVKNIRKLKELLYNIINPLISILRWPYYFILILYYLLQEIWFVIKLKLGKI